MVEAGSIDVGGDAGDLQRVARQGRLGGVQREVGVDEGIVDVDDRRILDLPGEVDHLDQRARRAVSVGRIAVDIGCEVPDSGAEFQVAAHAMILILGKILCLSVRRSEEHTSELQSLMRISYAVFCLKKKKQKTH